jgi:hypothetical protein
VPSPKNAIERRLEQLESDWNAFAVKPDARLLIWQADGDEGQMVELFLALQREGAGAVPDLFVRCEVPFETDQPYGLALIADLRRQYEEARTALAADEISLDWSFPDPLPGEDDAAAFARCCASFRAHHQTLAVNHLVAALTPAGIASPAAWRDWLLRLARTGLPENVRVTVLDSALASLLGPLQAAEPKRVAAVPVELDMPGAYLELVREARGSGPGHAFRRLFVALTNAARKGDVAQVQRTAPVALAIAQREQWGGQQVAIHLLVGGVLLAAGNAAEALDSYRAAGAAAAAAWAGDPAAPKLLVTTRIAEASALIAAGRYPEAATVYDATAPLAAEQNDHLMALESWRMAAYCHEQAGAFDDAWQRGEQALAAGARLDPDGRRNSTLPYAGQGLLRLTKRRPYRGRGDAVRRRLAELLGPQWETSLANGRARP